MITPVWKSIFHRPKAVLGMVHVRALPGTPYHELPISEIRDRAVEEAELLIRAGCDGILAENMHDRPYLSGRIGPEIVAAMTAVVAALRDTFEVPIGVQILAAANRCALAVAHAAGAQFIRAENFVFAQVADEGIMPLAEAGSLLRYRRRIGAGGIAIWADVKKKHASHCLTADVDLAETVRAAEFFGADGVIITGAATGQPAAPLDVHSAAAAAQVPVAVGSGLTAANLAEYWDHAEAFIVGSALKRDGLWSNPLDPGRIQQFMETVARLRASP